MQSTRRRIITVHTHIFDGKHISQITCTLSFLDIPPGWHLHHIQVITLNTSLSSTNISSASTRWKQAPISHHMITQSPGCLSPRWYMWQRTNLFRHVYLQTLHKIDWSSRINVAFTATYYHLIKHGYLQTLQDRLALRNYHRIHSDLLYLVDMPQAILTLKSLVNWICSITTEPWRRKGILYHH